MTLVVFLLACYGVTTIVTQGRIFAPVRAAIARISEPAGHWIRCPMCFSVPVGIGWALLELFPPTGAARWVDVAAAGAVSSGFCWVTRVVMHRLGEDDL
jgi:hypothetical protein